MRPFDPRLLRHARATRGFLVATTALSLVGVTLVVAQAVLLASIISGAALSGGGLAELRGDLLALAGVVAGRAAVAWGQEITADRAAAGVKSDLRRRLLAHVARLGPAWLTGQRAGEITTLATRGLDALDAYFARYLPQLVLAALVPAVVLAWVIPADPVAGLTIALTLPLIPLFLALVGTATERRNRAQFTALTRLGHHLLEVITGLPTLKAFGRARHQAAAIARLSADQARLSMRTLRLAFLSSLVLELLATLSVALVAVGVGLRVVSGTLDLRTALIVLILAPEAYLPLRQLGVQYHASAEGLAAAGRVFEVLETEPGPAGGRRDLPDPRGHPLVVEGVSVTYPGTGAPALPAVSLRVEPGEVVALTGPSGCGKSTLLNVLLGFRRPDTGQVRLGDGPTAVNLADVDPTAWRTQIAYVPQRPYLFPGTVASNIALGRAGVGDPATDDAVRWAADEAGLADLPAGLSTPVGEDGHGLSAGQRQRVALARALLRPAALFILDEPTASLDPEIEADILTRLRRAAAGRSVVLVAHRPAPLAAADRVVPMGEPVVLTADRAEALV